MFPIDLNTADRQLLLRVPGLGAQTVKKIIAVRRYATLSSEDLTKMRLPLDKLKPFITVSNYKPALYLLDTENLSMMLKQPQQLDLFGSSVAGNTT